MPSPGTKNGSPQHSNGNYVLGIDIGTTTVKASLVSDVTRSVVDSRSQETKASLPSDQGLTGSEQDVHRICTALQFCLSRLPRESLGRVTNIAISGQMHGVTLWKSGECWKQNQHGRYDVSNKVSCLFTWQDGRCTPEFLASLPRPNSHLRLSTGHGCATLFWLLRNRPGVLESYNRAGTIQDLVVTMLCGLDKPIMSVQNAASWGYFNTNERDWNRESLQEAGMPEEWLPKVVQAGEIVGHTSSPWYGVPSGVPVYAALGDLQCSVCSTLEDEKHAVVNMSTSAQISFILPEGFKPPEVSPSGPIEYFPYFRGRYLAVAASLNGGNVLAAFVRMLQQWTHDLGLGVPESKIWERILSLAGDDSTAASGELSEVGLMEVIPTLYGERHLPDQRASIRQVEPSSLSLGRVFRSICKGIIQNLLSMMSKSDLEEAGITRIVGCGTALTKNLILKQELERLYEIPVTYVSGNDAAVGAAMSILPQL